MLGSCGLWGLVFEGGCGAAVAWGPGCDELRPVVVCLKKGTGKQRDAYGEEECNRRYDFAEETPKEYRKTSSRSRLE